MTQSLRYPRALLDAYFARDVYRDAARNRRGVGMLFTLLLAAIVTLLAVLRIAFALSGFAAGEAPRIIAQLPTITVDHGRVAIDRPSPVTIHDPRTGAPIAVIDTSGAVPSLEGSEAWLLLTRDRLIYRKSAAETRVFELAGVPHFVLDRDRATRWVRGATMWGPWIAMPFILVAMLVARLIQQLLAALAVLLVGRGAALDFAAAMRLGVLAIAPATITLDLAGFAGLKVPASGWLWCAITVGYVLFAVAACRTPAPAGPIDSPDLGL
ncbi:MAG: DUF1189 family protein [Candidatus Eisenbacteria bacterium]|uniref:DUF1189 family protein n=1 Tax=Eiseniibacteriota bacterium TaxID=2212470 RepID=A0A9D6QIA8_UNCEI|nr:DUF1189 family protein [Candidatus Eisenbacteria bacterium]MBI3539107.1 DUF1189 family protein [Candidatus Eisenbacteria bacterium]